MLSPKTFNKISMYLLSTRLLFLKLVTNLENDVPDLHNESTYIQGVKATPKAPAPNTTHE